MEYITSFKLWALHSSVYTYPYDSKRSYSKTLVKSIHLSNSRERTLKYMRAIDESLDTVWPIKNLCLSRTCSKASIRWWLRRKLLRERLFFFFFFFTMYKLFQAGRGFSLNYYLYYIYKCRLHYKHAKYLRENVITSVCRLIIVWHYFHYFYKDIECQTFSLLADYVIRYVLTIEILYISKISMIFLCDKSGAIGKKSKRSKRHRLWNFFLVEFMENLNIDLLHEKSINIIHRWDEFRRTMSVFFFFLHSR